MLRCAKLGGSDFSASTVLCIIGVCPWLYGAGRRRACPLPARCPSFLLAPFACV